MPSRRTLLQTAQLTLPLRVAVLFAESRATPAPRHDAIAEVGRIAGAWAKG